jgi:hypothetical protein
MFTLVGNTRGMLNFNFGLYWRTKRDPIKALPELMLHFPGSNIEGRDLQNPAKNSLCVAIFECTLD